MDDLESYESPGSVLLEVEPGWATLRIEEGIPSSGEAIAVELESGDVLHVVARERLGGRKVRAFRLDDRELEAGLGVSPTGRRAGFRLPDDDVLDLDEISIVPEPEDATDGWIPLDWSTPEFTALRADHPAVATGFEGIDRVAPVVEGGMNLLIDNSGEREVRDALFRAIVETLSPDEVVRAPAEEPESATERLVRARGGAHRQMAAVRLAVALAADARDRGLEICLALDLPTVGHTAASEEAHALRPGYGELIDIVGSALASTQSGAVTTLLRLPLGADVGIEPIVETLDLGDVDAQIFVDDEGRFVPNRSTSDADRTEEQREHEREILRVLRRAERVQDKSRVLGDQELDDDERQTLERAAELRVDLSTPPDGTD